MLLLLAAACLCTAATTAMAMDNSTEPKIQFWDLKDFTLDVFQTQFTADELRDMDNNDVSRIVTTGVSELDQAGRLGLVTDSDVGELVQETQGWLVGWQRAHKVAYVGRSYADHSLVQKKISWLMLSRMAFAGGDYKPLELNARNAVTQGIYNALPRSVALFGYHTALADSQSREGFPLN